MGSCAERCRMNNDLISRSELLEFAHNHVNCTVDCNDIARFPSVDAESVRHGKWEHGMRCSFCKQIDTAKPNYCPNCGVKMDAKEV